MPEPNYTLPESFTVKEIDEIKTDLQEILKIHEGQQVDIDGSKVRSVDASGIQLILSFYKSLLIKGKGLALHNPSENLQWALERSGAREIF